MLARSAALSSVIIPAGMAACILSCCARSVCADQAAAKAHASSPTLLIQSICTST